MTRLQVELAKANKRIKRACLKTFDCDGITVSYSGWNIVIHVWRGDDIIQLIMCHVDSTTKEIVQQVRTTEV